MRKENDAEGNQSRGTNKLQVDMQSFAEQIALMNECAGRRQNLARQHDSFS